VNLTPFWQPVIRGSNIFLGFRQNLRENEPSNTRPLFLRFPLSRSNNMAYTM